MLLNLREDSYSSLSYILHIIHNPKSPPCTSSKCPCLAMSTLLYGCSCHGHQLSQPLSLLSHHTDLSTPPYHHLQHLINPLTNPIPCLKTQQQELMTCPAARLLDVEPEKERQQGTMRDWYTQGLSNTPGTMPTAQVLKWERPSPPTSRASPVIPRVSGRQTGSAQIMEADSEEFFCQLNISCHK